MRFEVFWIPDQVGNEEQEAFHLFRTICGVLERELSSDLHFVQDPTKQFPGFKESGLFVT